MGIVDRLNPVYPNLAKSITVKYARSNYLDLYNDAIYISVDRYS